MNPATALKLGLSPGDSVRVRQGQGEAVVRLDVDANLPHDCVRLAAAHSVCSGLGPMFGEVSVERAG
jgi:NADH-quinone oxidoreductase subunit G